MSLANSAEIRVQRELTTDITPGAVEELRSSGLGQSTQRTILEAAGFPHMGITIDALI